jgi:LAGLIDADG DNA endonuclease family protein
MLSEIYERKHYTTAQIAYLAGIIDGEGSLTIGNYSSNKKTGAIHYQTSVQVNNTHEGLILWIHNIFGGNIVRYTEKQTPKNARQAIFRWIANGERLTHICELIVPFIVVKQRQVQIMLRMRETYKIRFKKGQQGFRGLNDEVLALRQSLFLEIRSLHCRKGSLS